MSDQQLISCWWDTGASTGTKAAIVRCSHFISIHRLLAATSSWGDQQAGNWGFYKYRDGPAKCNAPHSETFKQQLQ